MLGLYCKILKTKIHFTTNIQTENFNRKHKRKKINLKKKMVQGSSLSLLSRVIVWDRYPTPDMEVPISE